MALDDRKAIERAWKEGADKMIEYNDANPAPGIRINHKIYGPFSNCSKEKREQLKNAMEEHVQERAKYYRNNKPKRLNSNPSADENSSLNLNPSADNSQKLQAKIKTKK
jgi:hypothetical protein